MADLTARVVPEHDPEFDAVLTNLGPSSVFVSTEQALRFRQAVTVKFEDIAVHGEVAFVCRVPAGAVVVFRPSPEALEVIEDRMDQTPELIGGGRATSLEDLENISDEELDRLPDSDPEGPTNTEGEPVEVEDEEGVGDEAEDEVREAFVRAKFLPNSRTERVGNEELLAAKSAGLARPQDRDPTVIPKPGADGRVPTLVEEEDGVDPTSTEPQTDLELEAIPEDETVGGRAASEPSVFEEHTEVPAEEAEAEAAKSG